MLLHYCRAGLDLIWNRWWCTIKVLTSNLDSLLNSWLKPYSHYLDPKSKLRFLSITHWFVSFHLKIFFWIIFLDNNLFDICNNFSLKKISFREHHLTYWRWIHRKQQFFRSWKLSQFTVSISRFFEDTKASNFRTGFCEAICRSQNRNARYVFFSLLLFSSLPTTTILTTTLLHGARTYMLWGMLGNGVF